MKRITGRRLQRIRADWFADHPLCVHCEAKGRISLAVQLDHIKPLDQGGLDFDRDGGTNRQGLCRDCHESKTIDDMGFQALPQRSGGDDSGMPTDPEHSWNRRK